MKIAISAVLGMFCLTMLAFGIAIAVGPPALDSGPDLQPATNEFDADGSAATATTPITTPITTPNTTLAANYRAFRRCGYGTGTDPAIRTRQTRVCRPYATAAARHEFLRA